MAALCLVPRVFAKSARSVRGKMHAAWVMRLPLIITPPSCIALFGKKIVSSISGVAIQSTTIPDSTTSASWTFCSIAINAPIRAFERFSAAVTMTSIFSRCWSTVDSSGILPSWASILRSSGWKMIMTAKIRTLQKFLRIHRSTVRFRAIVMRARDSIRPTNPMKIGQPRVPRTTLNA